MHEAPSRDTSRLAGNLAQVSASEGRVARKQVKKPDALGLGNWGCRSAMLPPAVREDVQGFNRLNLRPPLAHAEINNLCRRRRLRIYRASTRPRLFAAEIQVEKADTTTPGTLQ